MDKEKVDRTGICSRCKQEKNIVFSIKLKQELHEWYRLLCAECYSELARCDVCDYSINLDDYEGHLLNDHSREQMAMCIEEAKYRYITSQ